MTMTDPSPSWLETMGQLVEAGGPIVLILAGLSVLALTVFFAKLLHFAGCRLWNLKPLEEALALWQRGETTEALARLHGNPHPAAAPLRAAMVGHGVTGNGNALREEVERLAAKGLDDLERGIRFIGLVAMLSPLLGLLGTVLGMIDAFQALESAGRQVDPSVLSGGIWVALLTTAAGLVVAVPAAAAHHWLEGICARAARGMEDLVTRAFTHAPEARAGIREAA